MAAPPSKDPSRLGKGPSSRPNPSGAGAFLTTPSTTTDTGYASSLLTAGSAQSGSGLSSARADIYPASSRFLRHSGLGGIINQRFFLQRPRFPPGYLRPAGRPNINPCVLTLLGCTQGQTYLYQQYGDRQIPHTSQWSVGTLAASPHLHLLSSMSSTAPSKAHTSSSPFTSPSPVPELQVFGVHIQ